MKPLDQVLRDWEAVIGLEVHAELTSLKTKMFCGCELEYGAAPNTRTCPVCLGLPGALPVPNEAAIEAAVLAGLATNCRIEKRSSFYRKNYMYPDMSKNYQITQGPVAFCMNGYLDVEVFARAAEGDAHACDSACDHVDDFACDHVGARVGDAARIGTRREVERTDDGYKVRIGIARIHLEEDAGKMVHVGGEDGRIAGATHSLVDYNRAGAPLIELVTEPDIRTPEEARRFMQKLRQIYRAIGISNCSMEEGSLRCDGNVSVRRRGSTELGVKAEIKNVNSFKTLHDGLAYEICRQVEVLEAGGFVRQETRHWDASAKRTVCLRTKEASDDYRLFPDPDLTPFDLSDEFVERVRTRLPELPDRKARRFAADYGLSAQDARQLSENDAVAALFDACMARMGSLTAVSEPDVPLERARKVKMLANVLVNDMAAYANAHPGVRVYEECASPEKLLALVDLQERDVVTPQQAREILAVVLEEDADPAVVAEVRGLTQTTDREAVREVVCGVLAQHSDKVEAYCAGKTALKGFFVGQCMRVMDGRGNPKLVHELLDEALCARMGCRN